MKHAVWMLLLCGALSASHGAAAKVTEQEAAALKTTLTPLGAERSGNKEGTIPAWEGGYTTVSPGYKSGDRRPDPFASDKPLFSITAQNADQYADKLSEGVLAMLRKYPDFRLDIYPTRRTSAAPQWVYDATYENALHAQTTEHGLKLEGAYAGIPFPIPHDGFEAMWNHLLSWQGIYNNTVFTTWVITADGQHVLSGKTTAYQQFPYYFHNVPREAFNGIYTESITAQSEPPYKAGEMLLVKDPVDQYGIGRQAWQYLTGQRRVRRAPLVSYDTPSPLLSGIGSYDEIFLFFGSLDRYNWKLVGKKELYIPYNSNGALHVPDEQLLGAHFFNPDHYRWELHRVWVVDATLAPGKRHIVPHRRFYLDEDTWRAAVSDGWDAEGNLWRLGLSGNLIVPEVPTLVPMLDVYYDLRTGVWALNNVFNSGAPLMKKEFDKPLEESFFTPDNLAKLGVR